MTFDPDKYLSETPSETFNPDTYLAQAGEADAEAGYIDGVRKEFSESSANISEVLTKANKRHIENPSSRSIKDLDNVYDALEIGGEFVEAGASLFGEAYSSIPKDVREMWEKPLAAGTESLYHALNIGGAVDNTIEKLTDVAKQYPQEAGALQDIAQVSGAAQASKLLTGAGTKVTPHKWRDVVLPADSREELKRRALSSKPTMLGTDVPKVAGWQKEMIRTLKKVKGVHPSNRNQVNLNAVISDIPGKAKVLGERLGKSKVKFNTKKLSKSLELKMGKEHKDNPIFDGFTTKELQRTHARAVRFIDEAGATPKGLWEARKRLDAFYEFHKGEKFVGGASNASQSSEAYRIAREFINDSLEEALPGAKKSLKEMRVLYNARDLLVDKAILDDPSLAGRMMDKVSKVVTIRPPVVRGGFYSPQGGK